MKVPFLLLMQIKKAIVYIFILIFTQNLFSIQLELNKTIVSKHFQNDYVVIDSLIKNQQFDLAVNHLNKLLSDINLNLNVDRKTFLYLKANVYHQQNISDSTIAVLNLAREIPTPDKPVLNERIFVLSGSVYTRISNYEAALQSYLNALTINKMTKDTLRYATNLNDIGLMYYYSGYTLKAFDYLDKSLKIKSALNNTENYYKTKMNLALILLDLERGTEAITYIKEYLDYSKKTNLNDDVICYYNLGLAYFLEKNTDSTFYYLNKALEISKQRNFKIGIAKVKYALAEKYAEMGLYEAAYKTSSEAINMGYNSVEFWGYTNLILAYSKFKLKHRDYLAPIKIVQDSLASKPNIGLEKELMNKLILISIDKNDYKSAYKYEKRLNEIKNELNNSHLALQLAELKIKSNIDSKEAEVRKLIFKNKLIKERVDSRNDLIIFLVIFVATLLLVFIYIFFQNQRINKLNIELKDSNTTILKFFSIISHDLRSPIGSFKMILDELNSNYDVISEEDRKVLINETNKEVNNTYKLLENLLTWAKASKGDFRLYYQEINASAEIDVIINSNRFKLKEKNIQIIKDYPDMLNISVDIDMFSTILRNILTNSIKFTNINGEIKISAIIEQSILKICIADNGIGMSGEQIENLFRIEKKVTRYGTNKEKGTGLGLIIVKELVEILKGKIEVSSENNIGTKVKIALPIRQDIS